MAENREYPDRPIVGVGAVVWRGDAVLLVRRGHPPLIGQWSLPGGAQEIGETVAEAACREVMEETGIRMTPGAVIDVIDFIDRDAEGTPRYHYTLVDILGRWRSGEPQAADDVAEARFFAPADLAGLEMWAETRRIIAMAADMRQEEALFSAPD